MRFNNINSLLVELRSHWQVVLKNKSTVKDVELKDLYSEEMILTTAMRNIKIIFDAVKGHNYGNYLKLLRALGIIIRDKNIDTVNRFDIIEGEK